MRGWNWQKDSIMRASENGKRLKRHCASLFPSTIGWAITGVATMDEFPWQQSDIFRATSPELWNGRSASELQRSRGGTSGPWQRRRVSDALLCLPKAGLKRLLNLFRSCLRCAKRWRAPAECIEKNTHKLPTAVFIFSGKT